MTNSESSKLEKIRRILGEEGRDFNAGVIGTGHDLNGAGIQIARELPRMPGLKELYIHNRTPYYAEWARKSVLGILRTLESDLEVSVSDISDIVRNTDIAIIAIENNPGYKKDIKDGKIKRIDVLSGNLEPIKELAQRFNGYKGRVIVITNPTDELSYVFCAYSGLPANQVLGFNHIDTFRFTNFIREICEEKLGYEDVTIDGFVIGPHNEGMVPIYSQTRINNIPFYDNDPLRAHTDYIKQKTKNYGNELMQSIGTSADNVASACLEAVHALMDGGVITMSTFLRLAEMPAFEEYKDRLAGDKGCYFGWPITAEGILKEFDLSEEEKQQVFESYVKTRKNIDDLLRGNLQDRNGNILKIDREIGEEETRKEQSSFVNKETLKKFPVSQKSQSDFSGSQKPTVSVKTVSYAKKPKISETKPVKVIIHKVQPFETTEITTTPQLEAILYAASGDFIVEINPNTLEIIREHDFGHTIRSVFVEGDSIYAGYKNGVLKKRKDNGEITDYRIQKAEIEGKGFASNSIALLNDYVFVSHSNFGVVKWQLDKPDKPVFVEKNPAHSLDSDGMLSFYYLRGFTDKLGFPHFTKIYTFAHFSKMGTVWRVLENKNLSDMVVSKAGDVYVCSETGEIYEVKQKGYWGSEKTLVLDLHKDLFVMKYFNDLLTIGYNTGVIILNPQKKIVEEYRSNDKVIATTPIIDNFVFIATGAEGSKDYHVHKWDINNPERAESVRLEHTIRDMTVYVR